MAELIGIIALGQKSDGNVCDEASEIAAHPGKPVIGSGI